MKDVSMIIWKLITEIVFGFSVVFLILCLAALYINGISIEYCLQSLIFLVLIVTIRGYWNLHEKRSEFLNLSELIVTSERIIVKAKISDDKLKNLYIIQILKKDTWSSPKFVYIDEYELEVGKIYEIKDEAKLSIIDCE